MRKKFIVLLTVGLNEPGIARSGLMFATLAAVSGYHTILYCVQEGAELMRKGAVDLEVQEREGAPTLKQRLSEALDAGVEIQICEATAVLKSLRNDDLIDEAKIVGGATLIAGAAEAEGVLSF